MTTRSSQLAWALTSTGTTTVGTVPTGRIWLLKSVYLESGATTGGVVALYVVNAAGTRQLKLLTLTTAGAVLMGTWSGWTVLLAGDKLRTTHSGTATNWYSLWSGANLAV